MNESDSYREWSPPASWAPVVACLWEHRVGRARQHRVFPDGFADIIVWDSGQIHVVGVHDRVDLPALNQGATARGVRLQPWAVASALGLPADQLRNTTTDLAAVIGDTTAHRLHEPRALDEWIGGIAVDPPLVNAVHLLRMPNATVAQVANQVGLSVRTLQRHFHHHVGVAPKVYQRIARLQQFLSVLPTTSIATAAQSAGYSDQAHLTREVRALTATTPTQLLGKTGA